MPLHITDDPRTPSQKICSACFYRHDLKVCCCFFGGFFMLTLYFLKLHFQTEISFKKKTNSVCN